MSIVPRCMLADLPRGVSPSRLAVHLKPKAVSKIRAGHPWVFEDSIQKKSREGNAGDVVVLYDTSDRIVAAGLYDPKSPIRIRVFQPNLSCPVIGRDLFAMHVHSAMEKRLPILNQNTTACRLLHGESDNFSGLVADCYENTVVFKLYTEAVIPWFGLIAEAVFKECPNLETGVLRISRNLEKSQVLRQFFPCGEFPLVFSRSGNDWNNPVSFLENSILFEADVLRGQKTGFFLDQRDNRMRASQLSDGRTVLNVFSYSGGFSLSAAKGGATKVTSIDMDPHAIDALKKHVQMNRAIHSAIRACEFEELTGDAFEMMQKLIQKKRKFDMVIVDPPSFAKSENEVPSALHSYGRLAKMADALLKNKGILMFASCSSRVSSTQFFQTVLSNCRVTEFERTAHAPDHPAKFPETSYLKCLYAVKNP